LRQPEKHEYHSNPSRLFQPTTQKRYSASTGRIRHRSNGWRKSIRPKGTVGIVKTEGGDADILKRWFSEEADIDIRKNGEIGEEITDFIQSQDVKSVVMTDGLMGCPHEEVVDYPEGGSCPMCPYWQNRDRFTGEIIH
jgi:hypothetical protein